VAFLSFQKLTWKIGIKDVIRIDLLKNNILDCVYAGKVQRPNEWFICTMDEG
jgi:hypothetical protein